MAPAGVAARPVSWVIDVPGVCWRHRAYSLVRDGCDWILLHTGERRICTVIGVRRIELDTERETHRTARMWAESMMHV